MQLLPKLFQTIPLLCLLLTGCASLGEVKKKDRDLSNSYDGVWTGEYETTKRYQQYSNWTFTCQQETSPLTLRIEDSRIQTLVSHKYVESLNETYISSTGKFKTTLPSSYKAKTSKHSDTQDSDIETRMIIEGILNPVGQGTGKFTFGYATSQFKGCNTELNFTSSQKLTENQTGTIPNLDDLEVASGQISSLEFYGQAEEEINAGNYDKNIWARVFVLVEGDEKKRKAKYIELRANQLAVLQARDRQQELSKQTNEKSKSRQKSVDVSGIDVTGVYSARITHHTYFDHWCYNNKNEFDIELKQNDNSVKGRLLSGVSGYLKGTLNENKLEFTYTTMKCGSKKLKGEWNLSTDGSSLENFGHFGGVRWSIKKIQ